MCERNVHKQPKCPVTRFCSFIQQLVIIVATETLTLQFRGDVQYLTSSTLPGFASLITS